MAKKRRLTESLPAQQAVSLGGLRSAILVGLAFLLLQVFVIPCDSLSVERGSAIAIPLVAIALGTLAIFYWPEGPRVGRAAEWILLSLGFWMALSTWMSIGQGNVRYALNEFWIWISFIFAFIAARRVLTTSESRKGILALILFCGIAMSLHAVYQKYVSLPATIQMYEQDPEGHLQSLGIDPSGQSAARFQFEGRLYAGEATGTFSLSTSLAIFCLFGFSIATTLAVGQRQQSRKELGVWGMAAAICFIGAVMSGSRIVLLIMVAILLTTALLAVVTLPSQLRSRWFKPVALAVLLVTPIFAGLIETYSVTLQAIVPDSIGYRFRYWQGSLAMFADDPFFGVGPGNFKSAYLQYRQPQMSERIAEPHNFLIESLTTGGLVAALLLLAFVVGCACFWRKPTERDDASEHKGQGDWVCILAGAFLGATMVGAWALISGIAPEILPYLISVPIGLVFFLNIRDWIGSPTTASEPAIVLCIASWFALSFAGGISVPGLIIPLMIAAAISISSSCESVKEHHYKMGLCWMLLGVAIFMLYVRGSLTPVLQCMALRQEADLQLKAGEFQRAQNLLAQASDADRFDPEPAQQLAAVVHSRLLQSDSATDRKVFNDAVERLLLRDPRNAASFRFVGDRCVMLFRRWGDMEDARMAAKYYEQALELDRSSIALRAQLALVWEGLGDQQRSISFWQEMNEISHLNQNAEAGLNMLYVLPMSRDSSAVEYKTIEELRLNRNPE